MHQTKRQRWKKGSSCSAGAKEPAGLWAGMSFFIERIQRLPGGSFARPKQRDHENAQFHEPFQK